MVVVASVQGVGEAVGTLGRLTSSMMNTVGGALVSAVGGTTSLALDTGATIYKVCASSRPPDAQLAAAASSRRAGERSGQVDAVVSGCAAESSRACRRS